MKENSLALLSDDYISPLLLNTLMREEIPALVRGKRLKGELERFCPSLKILNKVEALDILSKEDNRVLISSEDFLSCVIASTSDPSKAERIIVLKDKGRFRELMREAYPEYFFQEAESSRLKDVKLPPGRSYIIKPSSGSKGIGVRIVNNSSDLEQMAKNLVHKTIQFSGTQDNMQLSEAKDNISLDPRRFLIEEYIKGDEFACDAYISPKGVPAVLGIYAHPLWNEEDFRDIVYYTSANVMRKMLPRVSDFLRRLSNRTGLRGIPIHARFRLQKNRLMPIDVNPLRFGSFSLPDLTFFAFRLNPYKHYYDYLMPDWDRILSQAGEDMFFRVLARMPEGAECKTPDHEEFADTIHDMIGYCKLDTKRYPAFSIAFGKTGNIDEIQKYLDLDLRNYIS